MSGCFWFHPSGKFEIVTASWSSWPIKLLIKILRKILIEIGIFVLNLPIGKYCGFPALDEIIRPISFELIGILIEEIVLLLKLTFIGITVNIGMVFSCFVILFGRLFHNSDKVAHLIRLVLIQFILNATDEFLFILVPCFNYLSIQSSLALCWLNAKCFRFVCDSFSSWTGHLRVLSLKLCSRRADSSTINHSWWTWAK